MAEFFLGWLLGLAFLLGWVLGLTVGVILARLADRPPQIGRAHV